MTMTSTVPHLSGRLAGATLASGDIEASLAFFRDELGMAVVAQARPAAADLERSWGIAVPRPGRVFTLAGGSDEVGLLRLLDVSAVDAPPIRAEPSIVDPGPLALDFAVEDLDDAHATLSARGYEFYSPPRDAHRLRICFVLAPDRVMTALIQFPGGHGLRGHRPYTGLINVAQVVEAMDADLDWYRDCFELHTTLNFIQEDTEDTRRLSDATRTPPGAVLHLVNLAEHEGIDGFQGSGTVELVEPVGCAGRSVCADAQPPRRGFFMTSLRVRDVERAHARCAASPRGTAPLTEVVPADELANAAHFVVRSPTGALLEVRQER